MTTPQLQEYHLNRNLRMVKAGVRSRAAGIRRCADCRTPFIAVDVKVPYCRRCRTNHTVQCRDCGNGFKGDPSGTVDQCKSCQHQDTLF